METNGSSQGGIEKENMRRKKLERLIDFLCALDRGEQCIVNNDMFLMTESGRLEVHNFRYKNGDIAISPTVDDLMSNLAKISKRELGSMPFDSANKRIAIWGEDGGCVDGRTHHALPGAYRWYKINVSTLLTIGQFLLYVREKREVMAQDGLVYSLHLKRVAQS